MNNNRSLRRSVNVAALTAVAASIVACATGGMTSAGGTKDYLLASGRWDNTIILIDVAKALIPANDGTPNAIVNRLRVTPDIDATGAGKRDTIASGQPISVVISGDQRRAYVTNHSGKATPAQAEYFQHGWPGLYPVVDLVKAVDPANNGTLNAVTGYIDAKNFGSTGFAISADDRYAAVAASEMPDSEDGGDRISIVDLRTHRVVGEVVQAHGKPGFPCPLTKLPRTSPDPKFGCYAGTNGVAMSPLGGGTIFTANGGTDDVSVISLQKALAGDPGAEVGRIPMQVGGFGLGTSPDGRLVVVAARESMSKGTEGNTISIIDVAKALATPATAEVARVRVGTDNPTTQTRPFAAAFTPDGKRIVVTHFRTNNISIVDVEKALAGQPSEIKRMTLETPDGKPSRPRGIAFTGNGKYAGITGAPKGGPNTGVVWLIDLDTYRVAGRVTQVGNESYLMGAFKGK
jgi:DNA-binding beta-propeller fold protein YncE